jgi:Family of unknown function (DUF6411)
MVIGAVIGFCVLIFILAFLFPRLSQGPERGGEKAMGAGSRGAGHAPGKLGTWLSKPFQKSSKAIARSGSAGRRGRARVD